MEPVNKAERNQTFLGFLVLYFLTIFIVIMVAVQSTKATLIENERLRKEMIGMHIEKNLSDSFKLAMDVVLNEIMKFDSKKEPVMVIQRQVQLKMERMNKIVRTMPDEKSIYDLIIQTLAQLSEAKLRIRNLEDQEAR